MSHTELKVAEINGPVTTYQEYHNAWKGFAYIWDSIWREYLKKSEYGHWMTSENSERLWKAVKDNGIPGWIRLILASTFDNAIVEYEKLPIIAQYYKDFEKQFSLGGNDISHLLEWSGDCAKIHSFYSNDNCAGICFSATSVGIDPWAGICFSATSVGIDPWEDYDLSKGDKHWFVFEEYSKILGLDLKDEK